MRAERPSEIIRARAPDVVRETLEEYGALVRVRLGDYLPKREPARWLYDVLPDYPDRGGKMMRPSLCIAAARAFGASVDQAVGSAVAIELLHNALLIHDDIEDESEERRGKPALNVLHGVPLALNVGDALALASLRPLAENIDRIGPRLAGEVLAETERMAWETVEGQAMELGWRRDNTADVDDADYLAMVMKKTCWLSTIHPLRVGALIATRGSADLDPLVRFGFFLGAAFQIQDDILNLEPDAAYGKELDGDLYEGKRTLMLIHVARCADAAERQRLTAFLALDRRAREPADVAWLRALMDRHGSIARARGVAHGLAGASLHEFDAVFGALPESRDKRFIQGVAAWIFRRG
jgi:geranylgeranyl diphosphate synthase type II